MATDLILFYYCTISEPYSYYSTFPTGYYAKTRLMNNTPVVINHSDTEILRFLEKIIVTEK